MESIFFIKNGEFEVSKKVRLEKPDLREDVVSSLVTVNDKLKRSMKLNNPATLGSDISLKSIRVVLLGAFEIFGLEDVIESRKARSYTITCTQNNSNVFVISKDNFLAQIAVMKVRDQLVYEKHLKDSFMVHRVWQTEAFRQKKVHEMETDRKNQILEKEM